MSDKASTDQASTDQASHERLMTVIMKGLPANRICDCKTCDHLRKEDNKRPFRHKKLLVEDVRKVCREAREFIFQDQLVRFLLKKFPTRRQLRVEDDLKEIDHRIENLKTREENLKAKPLALALWELDIYISTLVFLYISAETSELKFGLKSR